MAHAHAKNRFWEVKTVTPVLLIAWTKRNVHLEMRNLKQTELQRLKNRG